MRELLAGWPRRYHGRRRRAADQITAVLRGHTQSMFPPWGFCLTPIPSCCSRGVRIPPHSGRVDSCVRSVSVCLTRSGSVNPGVPSNPHFFFWSDEDILENNTPPRNVPTRPRQCPSDRSFYLLCRGLSTCVCVCVVCFDGCRRRCRCCCFCCDWRGECLSTYV
eukprot:COSAG01_NODE_1529_length_10001_cov_2.242583_2_plen_164_part_00